MTRQEAIRKACRIVATVFQSRYGDEPPHACDCFCDQGAAYRDEERRRGTGAAVHGLNTFKMEGDELDYVLAAVEEKLQRDGHTVVRPPEDRP